MAKQRSAQERRERLAAWLDSIESRVKNRLRKLELPEEIADLQEHLSKAFTQKGRNLSDDALLSCLARMKPGEWKAYDLLCCLACLRNSRQLLERHEPEGVALQAYVLGVRAATAGVRDLEDSAQRYEDFREGGRQGGLKRHGGAGKIRNRHRSWQAELDKLHARKPHLGWTRLSELVGKKFKVHPTTVRKACDNPKKVVRKPVTHR